MFNKKISKRDLLAAASKISVASGLCFPAIIGCKPKSSQETNSQLDFINMRNRFELDRLPQRVQSVKQLKFIQNTKGMNDERTLTAIAERAALLPDEYLKYLEESHQRGFFLEVNNFSASWAGLCYLGDPPKSVQVQNSSITSGYVLNHECGHALMYGSFKGVGGRQVSQSMLSKIYSQVRSSSESSKTWSYAMSNYHEYWACGFSSFYASERAREDLKTNYPLAYEFFSRSLVAPPQDSSYGSAISSGTNSSQGDTIPGYSSGRDSSPPPGQGGLQPPSKQNTLSPDFLTLIDQFAQMLSNSLLNQQAYSLTQKPRIDNIHDDMEINEKSEVFLELVTGFRDFNENTVNNYKVLLRSAISGRNMELRTDFKFANFLAPGNVISKLDIPSHEKLRDIVGSQFGRTREGINQTPFELIVLDSSNNIVGKRVLNYVQTHVDTLERELLPNQFAYIHKKS
jgi:hypothetical protein